MKHIFTTVCALALVLAGTDPRWPPRRGRQRIPRRTRAIIRFPWRNILHYKIREVLGQGHPCPCQVMCRTVRRICCRSV